MSMTKSPPKQGIVTILCSDSERAACRTATSLRRTLSADMSSRKWLSQHGFSPMKKIASSEELSNLITGEEEQVNAGPFDIWSSIVSQKGTQEDKSSSSLPYVHPLVKRSGSCLSHNSLQLCTESLGSETGSDGFSSSDSDSDHQHPHYEDVPVAKNNSAKKSPPPSFPPPLPSLTSRRDGPSSLRMTPRRENGRLVLEAVSVSAQNNFRAERQDGRLVLTLLTEPKINLELAEKDEEYDQGFEYNDEEEDRKRGGEIGIIRPNMSSSGAIKLHRLALTINRPASLLTKNPQWPHKFNESLPPLTAPPPQNVYDCWWRAKPTAAQAMEKNSGNKYIISKNIYYNQPEAVGHYINFNLKGCKDHRRSLFREPYCITTT